MDKSRFDDYITRFNAQDNAAFDDYFNADFRCLNGRLEIVGIDGWKRHYAEIWRTFREELDVQQWVGTQDVMAIRMHAHFTALADDDESLFGPVVKGHVFDFYGLIMYELKHGKISRIQVAYNSFTSTAPDSNTHELGIPH